MAKVLVTGGSGFLGSWTLLQLLAAGHAVATTVRDLGREPDVRAMLSSGGAPLDSRIQYHKANLLTDDGWDDAVKDCEYVLHVASPFGGSESESELIRAAEGGALRVLRAARDAGVRRVVLTSSFAAVGYGHPPRAAPFTEEDWTNVKQPDVAPYIKSKALAERAAWDFRSRRSPTAGSTARRIAGSTNPLTTEIDLPLMRPPWSRGPAIFRVRPAGRW